MDWRQISTDDQSFINRERKLSHKEGMQLRMFLIQRSQGSATVNEICGDRVEYVRDYINSATYNNK